MPVDMMPGYLSAFLGSDYIDLRPLGEDGGLSRLFRAHKVSLDVDVVIKRMRMDPRHPANVRREVQIMTSLRHQYLPRVYDFRTDDQGYCYTIMELIPGCTLRRYVQQYGALDQALALKWLKQMSEAVQYMHSQHVIHSDIKPENIMITPAGDICLIDFNASLVLIDEPVEAVGATACYAAPEQYNVPLERFGDPSRLPPQRQILYNMAVQAQGMGKVTERTDVFAIGAIGYYMMTGYDPPRWNEPQISLTRYDIRLGDALRQVIERCMEPQSARRFSSAKAALQAMNNLSRMDKRYAAWRRSCQVWAVIIGAGLLLSAFAVVQGVLTISRERGEGYTALVTEAQGTADVMRQQELLLEAISMDPTRPEAYANLGLLLYQLGDYQQAVELLEQVDPNNTGDLSQSEASRVQGQIQYVLASCYYQLQSYDNALKGYQQAVYFCPEETAYQRDLAVCCARLGLADQAQQALNVLNGMTTRPGDVELVSGEIAYAQGRYDEALTLLSAAAGSSDDHTVVLRAAVQAAQCCQRLGDARKEADILSAAAGRLDMGENGAVIQLQAEALMRLAIQEPARQQEHYEAALTCLNGLIDRGQATFTVRQNAALVLEYLDRFQESETLLLALQADFPMDYRPPMRLALLYADWEGTKPAGQRSYDRFLACYEEAKRLYTGAVPDSEMTRLEEMAAQLNA